MCNSKNAQISHLMSGWWWTVDFPLTGAAQGTVPLKLTSTQYRAPKNFSTVKE
jgi:hypothetical protein